MKRRILVSLDLEPGNLPNPESTIEFIAGSLEKSLDAMAAGFNRTAGLTFSGASLKTSVDLVAPIDLSGPDDVDEGEQRVDITEAGRQALRDADGLSPLVPQDLAAGFAHHAVKAIVDSLPPQIEPHMAVCVLVFGQDAHGGYATYAANAKRDQAVPALERLLESIRDGKVTPPPKGAA